MKICHLSVLPVLGWSQQDDSPTLLSLKLKVHSALETGMDHLLDSIGSRNVTQMSSLVQNLVEETIAGGSEGYELDGEVKAALQMIKEALLGDIRGALKEAHCLDQKQLHDDILCFEDCEKKRWEGAKSCGSLCDGKAHQTCRDSLVGLYKDHITKCRALDDWVSDFSKTKCPSLEKKCCLLSMSTWNCGACSAAVGKADVDDYLGTWLAKQIEIFEAGEREWKSLYGACTAAYKAYVEKDAQCDCAQAECETRNCEYESCHFLNCEDTYHKCWARCQGIKDETEKNKECLEKDRKIDWSATEKIECYVDVLLKKPSNETLLEKCGSTDCINKFREQEYKKCNHVCVEVDFDAKERSHHDRREDDIDLTDEGKDSVYTKHRGKGENRCTSHLDLDYQHCPCYNKCEERPVAPCGECEEKGTYQWLHYGQYGYCSTDKVPGVSEQVCKKNQGEHQQAYAYNLCTCINCPKNPPPGPTPECDECTGDYGGDGDYDYSQHYIPDGACSTKPPPMDLPESNCPVPAHSKSCHFWGDPHVTHLFYSHNRGKIADTTKGGRQRHGSILEFRPFGVFDVATNEDNSFEAQQFFCPWRHTPAPGVSAGMALKFGDDMIHIIRGGSGGKNSLHSGGFNKDTTEFYINGARVQWDELGNATATQIRGNQVPGKGGMTTGFMFMQQEKTNLGNPVLPVCVGNNQDTLVEVGVEHMYFQDVTIRTSKPGKRGFCAVADGKMPKYDEKVHEQYRTPPKKNLFTTRMMKHLCSVCNLEVHTDRWGTTCGAPGFDVTAEEVCKGTGVDVAEAKAECAKEFEAGTDWHEACVMETCAGDTKAVAIAKIEEHIQKNLIAEEEE